MARILAVLAIVLSTSIALEAGGPGDCNGNGVPDEIDTELSFQHELIDDLEIRDLSAADLDGDGDLDAVYSGNPLHWRENLDGTGVFGPMQSVFEGFAPNFALGDVDGDGDIDVVRGGATLAWERNLGGSFEPGPEQPVIGPSTIELGDLDGDGDLDVLGTYAHPLSVRGLVWFQNLDGQGNFGPATTISDVPTDPTRIRAADLDGDGYVDVVSSSDHPGRIAWYRNLDGAGTFGAQRVIAGVPLFTDDVRVGDIDGDGDLDVAYSGSRFVAWFENLDGAGNFGPTRYLTATMTTVSAIVLADLDGDSDLDLLAAEEHFQKYPKRFENTDGAGNFDTGVTFSFLDGTSSLFAADLDGDGDTDVLSTGFYFSSAPHMHRNESDDCNGNGLPDECDRIAEDCDVNGIVDSCDQAQGNGQDCNANELMDSCDIESGSSLDCTGDGVPDECEPDCNGNSTADSCDIAFGGSADCTGDGVPDECEPDCNGNSLADSCDIVLGGYEDCDANGIPDTCEPDCNGNFVADACDIGLVSFDCNTNGVPDECEIDCNANGLADECEVKPAFQDRSVSGLVDGAQAVAAADVDGDGDQDLLSTSGLEDELWWHRNLDGAGQFAAAQYVDGVDGAEDVIACDLDGDGDADAIVAVTDDDQVWWYEFLAESDSFSGPRVLVASAPDVVGLAAADLDRDGDLDVAYVTPGDSRVNWVENLDGSGSFSAPHFLTNSLEGPTNVVVADLDGDTDPDLVVGAADPESGVGWFRNLDGFGQFGPLQVVPVVLDAVSVVTAGDVDGDGLVDLLVTGGPAGQVYWLENLGAAGFGPQRLVGAAGNLKALFTADLDRDGDLDVVGAATFESRVIWYENLDGLGSFGPTRVVSATVVGVRDAVPVDIDGDGDLDVASASFDADAVIWHENASSDCNDNDSPDDCDIETGASDDCDVNGLPDECDIQFYGLDCNGNAVLDACDVGAGSSQDCDSNLVPDECEPDCNGNGAPDACDISEGVSADCGGEGIPDECEVDCNSNGLADSCDAIDGTGSDCNGDGLLDECEADCDLDGLPDVCSAEPTFSNHVISTDVPLARALVTADFDGDGDVDLAAASLEADRIGWYANLDGAGSFGAEQVVTTAALNPMALAVGDLDGDTDLDLVSGSLDDKLAWYENLDALGSFGPQQVVSVEGDGVASVAVADFDGDGDLDLVASSINDGEIAVYENLDGLGGFGPRRLLVPVVDDPVEIRVADINGDGQPDIVVAAQTANLIVWFRNVGGIFPLGYSYLASLVSPASIAVGDVDGDGGPDVVSRSWDAGAVWYENLEGGDSFELARSVADAVAPSAVGLGDLDGDGDLDAVVATPVDGPVSWYANDGVGSYGIGYSLPVTTGFARDLVVEDIDGDGDRDVVVAVDGRLEWLENEGDDCDGNGIPDACEPDCNANGVTDRCDLRSGHSTDCDGNGVPDTCDAPCEGECDADADGCIDGVDTAPSDASVCGDSDGDLCEDCSGGSFDPDNDGVDADGDGYCDAGDCLPADPSAWRVPSPIRKLTVSRAGLSWTGSLDPGGLLTRYDTLEAASPLEFEAFGVCFETDGSDTSTVHLDSPEPGAAFYFLIRVENGCPSGSLGSNSSGEARQALACE